MKTTQTKKLIFYTLAFIVLAVAIGAGFSRINAVLIVGFLAFIFIMFINNLDRISEIKANGKGFEAKTREVIEEAKITIKEMQNMVKLISTTELSLVMRTGRWGGYSDEEKEILKDNVLDILTQLNISKEEQEIVLVEWHKWIIFDYVNYILGGPTIPSGVSKYVINQWKQLRRRGINDKPTPDELTAFLQSSNCLTDKRKDLIEDYKYFIKYKKHRRPDEWHNRANWGVLGKNDS